MPGCQPRVNVSVASIVTYKPATSPSPAATRGLSISTMSSGTSLRGEMRASPLLSVIWIKASILLFGHGAAGLGQAMINGAFESRDGDHESVDFASECVDTAAQVLARLAVKRVHLPAQSSDARHEPAKEGGVTRHQHCNQRGDNLSVGEAVNHVVWRRFSRIFPTARGAGTRRGSGSRAVPGGCPISSRG